MRHNEKHLGKDNETLVKVARAGADYKRNNITKVDQMT